MKKKYAIALLVVAVAFGIFITLNAMGKKAPVINSQAPNFKLSDTNGKEHSLGDFKGKYVVLEWTNQGCPYVRKHYDSKNMQSLQKKWTDKGVVWLSICSSAEGKQGHMTNAEWKKTIKKEGMFSTAVLIDESGRVGKKYGAQTTPHMYIVDPTGLLIYQGAIDDTPSYKSEDVKGAHNYVTAALNDSMGGKPVYHVATKPYGCSVKYK